MWSCQWTWGWLWWLRPITMFTFKSKWKKESSLSWGFTTMRANSFWKWKEITCRKFLRFSTSLMYMKLINSMQKSSWKLRNLWEKLMLCRTDLSGSLRPITKRRWRREELRKTVSLLCQRPKLMKRKDESMLKWLFKSWNLKLKLDLKLPKQRVKHWNKRLTLNWIIATTFNQWGTKRQECKCHKCLRKWPKKENSLFQEPQVNKFSINSLMWSKLLIQPLPRNLKKKNEKSD